MLGEIEWLYSRIVGRCPALPKVRNGSKPGLPPWGPHVRFRRVQTLVREGSSLVKLRNSAQSPMAVVGSIVHNTPCERDRMPWPKRIQAGSDAGWRL